MQLIVLGNHEKNLKTMLRQGKDGLGRAKRRLCEPQQLQLSGIIETQALNANGSAAGHRPALLCLSDFSGGGNYSAERVGLKDEDYDYD
jgi:hypothetical protein